MRGGGIEAGRGRRKGEPRSTHVNNVNVFELGHGEVFEDFAP